LRIVALLPEGVDAGEIDAGRPQPSRQRGVRQGAAHRLEIPDLAGTEPDPIAALDTAFAHLRRGWPDP
jgi:hypothetical protein